MPGEAVEGEDYPRETGERLTAHRRRRGMKVSQLARVIGVSPSLISQIERGQSRPSVSTLSVALAVGPTVRGSVFSDAILPIATLSPRAQAGGAGGVLWGAWVRGRSR